MKTKLLSFPKMLSIAFLGTVLSLGVLYSSTTHAANGCGYGNHMNAWGRCVPNNPGPWATAIPGRPDCWRNVNGNVRCYR